ncbi:MAG TPA: hypothetical protein VMY59_03980 [Candidatus Thermoplasmatota archaeon]|nr:hypothetical protein [Candidatus Thermoplasmatota archaeon]
MKKGETRGWHSRGSNHYNWKEKPNYQALHKWIQRNKPKTFACENCGASETRLECANISGRYLRDISDYKWWCRKCHMESDGRFANLKQGDIAIFQSEIYISYGVRICSVCKEIKPLSQFPPNKYKKSGLQSYCRLCGRKQCHNYGIKTNWGKHPIRGVIK